MTENEIKDLAREYAKHECQATRDDEQREIDEIIEYDFALPVLEWLSERFCIVEKSEVAKWIKDIEYAIPDNRTKIMVEIGAKSLFGKELFLNTEQ